MPQDQIFVEYILNNLVEHPEDIQITRKVDDMGVLITVSLNKDDMGRVIGRDGQTAKAIRNILHVMGMKNGSRVYLKITDPI